MPTVAELRVNRTKLIAETQKLALKTTYTGEERARIDRMYDDVVNIEKALAILESGETRSTGRVPRAQPGQNTISDEALTAERRAFVNYLKTGERDKTLLREQRDLNTGNTSVIVAQDFLPQLIEAKKAWGQLTTAVNQKVTRNGEPLKIPGVDDTANMSTIIGESTSANPVVVQEKDPNFAGFINNVSFMSTGEVKISLAELEDSYFDLDAWIRDAFGKRIARGLSSLIVSGSQDGNFQSIIGTAQQSVTTQTAPTASAPALGYGSFVQMYSALDPAYIQDASWVMNSTTRGEILGLTDNFGRPLFVPSVNTDNLDRILGLPVVISQYHPNAVAGAAGVIQLGSLTDGYTLRTAGDVSILRLNERYADTGQVAFIGYHRNSGFATPVGAPIINLNMHA